MGIGPSTKETSMHHFRDPLLDVASADEDIDLLGIILLGSPDGNADKMLVGTRAAVWAQGMRADGALISADGWGNSHVDYANTCEQLGKRGIAVAGLAFNGKNGKFVVTNNYLDAIVDFCKNKDGIESNILGENNMTPTDCRKALALLKLKMRKAEKEREA